MTNTASGPIYPTKWRVVDVINSVECRHLSDDTVQLKWPGYTQTINQEGFNLYRQNEDLTPGYTTFDNWCEENHNHPIPVSDNEQS